MAENVSSFIERYQMLYEKDPSSKVFAPLAEAYRRMGLVSEAIDLAEKGVKTHPNFASGRVALGKCYVQKNQYEKAIEHLKVAVDLSPENLLAHQLLAECFLRLKKIPEALSSFKMVLFLNPQDKKVAQVVQKLEEEVYATSETDGEKAEEEFAMERIREVPTRLAAGTPSEVAPSEAANGFKNEKEAREFERELALLDARIDRGDWENARKQVAELLGKHPGHQELLNRKGYMDELTNNSFIDVELLEPLKTDLNKPKIEKLQRLLERIETLRKA